jgi:hypothetical protein
MGDKPDHSSIRHLYKLHIRGTLKNALVVVKTIHICSLTRTVAKAIENESTKTYINTKVIKHLYDKRPAEEFEFLIDNIECIVKYPNHIYRNRDGKRGDFCFVKAIKNEKYIVSIGISEIILDGEKKETANFVATAFRLRKETYLNSYELIWSWKVGNPSS